MKITDPDELKLLLIDEVKIWCVQDEMLGLVYGWDPEDSARLMNVIKLIRAELYLNYWEAWGRHCLLKEKIKKSGNIEE